MCCVLFILASVHALRLQATDDPPADEVPQGEVMQFTFEGSKIFPGTVRSYWVYVPQQYDSAKPACVYVNQDGIQYNAPLFSMS
jgi:enterochelin esterase-like enzyme